MIKGKKWSMMSFCLMIRHEKEGDERVNDLVYADSISFFGLNLTYCFSRNDMKETREGILWRYARIPKNLREAVAQLYSEDEKLRALVRACTAGIE